MSNASVFFNLPVEAVKCTDLIEGDHGTYILRDRMGYIVAERMSVNHAIQIERLLNKVLDNE